MNIGKVVYYILDKSLIDFRPKLYFYGSIGSNFQWPVKEGDIPLAYSAMHKHKSQAHIWKGTRMLYRMLLKIYGSKLKGWKFAEGYRRVYYGKEGQKNKNLKLSGRILLLLCVKYWPEKVTRH